MLNFFSTLINHLPGFLALVMIIASCLYLLLKRHIYSIFDPLFFFLVINEAFCIADVLFMFQHGLIESRYFTNYLLTESALFVGLLQFRPASRKIVSESSIRIQPAALRILFKTSIFFLIGLNLLVYSQRGIPLLLDSRMVVYSIGGGWGLISRLFDVLTAVIIYYLLDILRHRNWRWMEWASMISVILIQILSGAKSGVIHLVFMAALFGGYTGDIVRSGSRAGRMFKRLTFASIAGLFLVASLQSGEGELAGRRVNVFGQVAVRMVNAGDALIYAYPDRFIEQLEGHNPFGAIFREYLAFFRLASPESLPKHLGVQITDVFIGPDSHFQTNAKHNIFGYVYFGYWGAILFSYLVGTSIGAARHLLPRALPKNWIGGISFMVINLALIMSCNDFDSGSRGLLNILVIFLPLALLAQQLTVRRASRPIVS